MCSSDLDPPILSSTFDFKHFLLPDALFVLRQTDVLEELSNVILLQIVMDEVLRINPTKYRRLREAAKNRNFFYFLNEHHKDTYVERHPDESPQLRNQRAFLKSFEYFCTHFNVFGIRVVILSDQKDVYDKHVEARKETAIATCEEYVTGLIGDAKSKGLDDKICRTPLNEDEGGAVGDFLYPAHEDMKTVQNGIKGGKYFQGVYRSRNFNEGFIRVDADQDQSEVLVRGRHNINRASDGMIASCLFARVFGKGQTIKLSKFLDS